ncbi:ABC transporter substrate-binding protein [Halarsenatibacter silvermanii]|uniref:ABC-type branched-chain amino acid transport system, substrate-binding protein n=1 Tax=Halarsenatibacter silvermanii TaxID=321763 RepID=A0A1G9I5S9_9FIRM|nr:ABC transporter substrate-binding protein [Halarsenatibacter silvermanii]SDL20610.1 ABC-type branched-chain amino acid transport system, substrate-binding protein [Halarsenatibacter silvermanii]
MKNKSLTFALGIFLAVVFTFTFTFTGAAEEYVIGTLTPMSGPSAPFGEAMYNAGELAAHYVNEAGGIHGYDLVLENRDTATEETTGVDAARRLVDVDGVPAIAGGYSSGVAMAVAEGVTIPQEVTFVTVGTSPMISIVDDNGYFFRTSGHGLQNGRVLGDAIAEDGHEEIGIIYVNNPYGEGLAKSTAATFEEYHDGEVVASVPFEIGQASYASEIARAYDDGNVDAAVIIAYPEDAEVMHGEVHAAGWTDIPWYGSPDQRVPDLVEALGADYMSGIALGTTQGRWDSPSRDSFYDGYEEQYGEEPPRPYMAPVFDGVSSIALAIAASDKGPDEVTGTDIRDHMREVTSPPGEEVHATAEGFARAFELLEEGEDVNFIGVGGAIEFDEYGDALSAIQLWTIDDDGSIVTIENRMEEPIPRDLMPPEFQE